jgi:hypothetical protein
MPTQDEALNALGQYEIVKVHDDSDLTVKDADGCFHVITTDGETFTEQSCECLNAMSKVEQSCPVSALPIEQHLRTADDDWQVPFEQTLPGRQTKGTQADAYWRNLHKEFVAKSLSEGKPVPAEVLADYPELTKGKHILYTPEEAEERKPEEVKPRFGYIGFYKGKQYEIYADTTYEAQKKIAEKYGIKDSYNIKVMLAEKDGKPVVHLPQDLEEGVVFAPTKPTPKVCGDVKELVGMETKAFGADPSNPHRYEFRYKVIELRDVITSHLENLEPNPAYPKELQPRIRDRAASKVQISSMAANLNPQMLLHDSGFLDTGPIIVGGDNVVESGNGRTLALRLAAREHPDKYQQYVEMLKANAADYGLSEADITKVCQPILVRERLTDGTRESFTTEANVGAVMRMSPYEQALQDSGRLSDYTIGNLVVGEEQSIDQALKAKANEHIVQHFVTTLPANERASISESGGAINQQGLDRLKLAIFAKTYPGKAGQRLVRIFGENVDPIIRSLETSMFQSLPDMAKAESLIGTGQRDKSLSVVEDMAEIVDALAILKQRKLKAKDYLAQKEMFEEKLTSNQKIMLEHIDDISHKPKLVRELLRNTAQRIVESPPPEQISMMGVSRLTKEDLINGLIQKQRVEQGLAPITELALAPGTSVQTGLAGIGKETAQVKMLEEFGAYASKKKQLLVDIEAARARLAAKPLPGQIKMVPKPQRKLVPVKISGPVTDLTCYAVAQDVKTKWVAVSKKPKGKWVAATELECTVSIK